MVSIIFQCQVSVSECNWLCLVCILLLNCANLWSQTIFLMHGVVIICVMVGDFCLQSVNESFICQFSLVQVYADSLCCKCKHTQLQNSWYKCKVQHCQVLKTIFADQRCLWNHSAVAGWQSSYCLLHPLPCAVLTANWVAAGTEETEGGGECRTGPEAFTSAWRAWQASGRDHQQTSWGWPPHKDKGKLRSGVVLEMCFLKNISTNNQMLSNTSWCFGLYFKCYLWSHYRITATQKVAGWLPRMPSWYNLLVLWASSSAVRRSPT